LFSGIEVRSSGTYECTAYNSVGMDSQQIKITNPELTPTLVPIPKPSSVVTLEAETIYDYPLNVNWKQNGTYLPTTSHWESHHVN